MWRKIKAAIRLILYHVFVLPIFLVFISLIAVVTALSDKPDWSETKYYFRYYFEEIQDDWEILISKKDKAND